MMRANIKGLVICACFFMSSLVLPGKLGAQSTASSSPAQGSSASTTDSLKNQISAEQKEIQQLQTALQQQQKLLDRLHPASPAPTKASAAGTAKPASAHPAAATAKTAAQPPDSVKEATGTAKTDQPAASPSDPAGQQVASNALPSAIAIEPPPAVPPGQQSNPAITNSPITPIPLKIGRATITPVGFVDATEFFRTENLGSGIGSSFGSVPFSNTTAGQLTENRLSIQNSRIGAELDSSFDGFQVRGYWESDFLGYQPNGAFQTSNSDSFRIRLYWARVRKGKFDFMAGQSWSLMTPGRVGISPMPSNIFYSQDMDTNYQMGLTWSRQLQFRFTYHASPSVTAALSIEDSDPFVGGATIPSAFTSETDNGSNNDAPAFVPDIVGKLAFDPKVDGRDMHFEFAGLLSNFKTFDPTTNTRSTATGGGGEFNFDLNLWKGFNLIASSYYSSGGGRYIIGLAPDFVVGPTGTISLDQADSGVGGFEYQFSPKTMLYGYYSAAYIGRDYSVVPPTTPGGTPTFYGFGYPGSANTMNRNIQEGTFGVIQTFWKNAHYGALQLITQYSYLTRFPWYVATGQPDDAHLSMVYLDVRYVLP
jgi:hypothetical protein